MRNHSDRHLLTECPVCGADVRRTKSTFEAHIGRRTVEVEGKFTRCVGGCGEVFFGPGEFDAVLKRAAERVRDEEGLLSPVEIRALRLSMDLTQPQFEEMLGTGPKTVVRWEKGTVFQNGATDTLLRVLRDVPEARQYLLHRRGIEPAVVPLFPEARPVSYHYQTEVREESFVETLAAYWQYILLPEPSAIVEMENDDPEPPKARDVA